VAVLKGCAWLIGKIPKHVLDRLIIVLFYAAMIFGTVCLNLKRASKACKKLLTV
jgi:hypothetical protein